jgi:hypothetical protein
MWRRPSAPWSSTHARIRLLGGRDLSAATDVRPVPRAGLIARRSAAESESMGTTQPVTVRSARRSPALLAVKRLTLAVALIAALAAPTLILSLVG